MQIHCLRVYTYDSVGNRVTLYNEDNTGTITSWRNYDIGRRTDTSAGPNQMLKSLDRSFFLIAGYRTYGYDADGAQNRRKLYNGSGVLQLDETFEYSSWRGLSWKYTRTDPNLLSGSDTWEYRYRYNAMGEREQKRETLNPAGDGTAANGYSWTYYLLGGSREQLSLWEGLQTSDATFCSPPGAGSYVNLYPTEYLVYGVEYPGVKEDVPRLRLLPNNTQEYRITDHLASVRSTLNNSGTVTNTYDYEPFGDILSGGGEARQGFNSREKDQEVDLFNNGVRKLDDNEGRFTSIDPLWEKFRSWSPYQYGYNNPVGVTDPGGMQNKPIIRPTNEPRPYQDAGGPFSDVAGGGGTGGGSGSLKNLWARVKGWFGGGSSSTSSTGTTASSPSSSAGGSSSTGGSGSGSSSTGSSGSGSSSGGGGGANNAPKGTLPRSPNGDYLPDPKAQGPHTTVGTRPSRKGGTYTQGATFDANGKFKGRTDVTDHGRPQNHINPHFHPATSSNSVSTKWIGTPGWSPLGKAQ